MRAPKLPISGSIYLSNAGRVVQKNQLYGYTERNVAIIEIKY